MRQIARRCVDDAPCTRVEQANGRVTAIASGFERWRRRGGGVVGRGDPARWRGGRRRRGGGRPTTRRCGGEGATGGGEVSAGGGRGRRSCVAAGRQGDGRQTQRLHAWAEHPGRAPRAVLKVIERNPGPSPCSPTRTTTADPGRDRDGAARRAPRPPRHPRPRRRDLPRATPRRHRCSRRASAVQTGAALRVRHRPHRARADPRSDARARHRLLRRHRPQSRPHAPRRRTTSSPRPPPARLPYALQHAVR